MKCTGRELLLVIFSVEEPRRSGTVFVPELNMRETFFGLDELILCIDRLQSVEDVPDNEPDYQFTYPGGAFWRSCAIRILSNGNQTWQGELRFPRSRRKLLFRSALELLELLHEATSMMVAPS